MPPAISLARRVPSALPVASITRTPTMRRSPASVRDCIHAGKKSRNAKNTGPKMVANANQRVRTRSRYSRAMIALSLAMAAHPRFHIGCTHSLQEHLVQRRTNYLKTLDTGSSGYQLLQQVARMRSILQQDREEPVLVIQPLDE